MSYVQYGLKIKKENVLIQGPVVFKTLYGSYTRAIIDPTGIDLINELDKIITQTGDYDHTFLEDIFKTDERKDGFDVWGVFLGS